MEDPDPRNVPASLQGLRVPFGERQGRLFTPREVDRGLECDCRCPFCGSRLVANQPSRTDRRPYFSHYRGADCPGGYESALHKMAIQIIEDAGFVDIPSKSITVSVPLIDDQSLSETIAFPPHRTHFLEVVSEKNVDKTASDYRWRPDLTARLKNGATLYIEVAFKHKSEDLKTRDLDNLMEIDLGLIDPDIVNDIDALSHQVLTQARRYWYRCSLYDDLEPVKQLRRRLEEEAARHNRRIERSRAEAEKGQAKVREIEQQRQALRERYEVQIRQLKKMAHPEAVRSREDYLKRRSVEGLRYAQQRLESECAPMKSLPDSVGLRVEGDWVIEADRRVWQAFVYDHFIWNKGRNTRVRAGQVAVAVIEEFGVLDWAMEFLELRRDPAMCASGSKKALWFLSGTENQLLPSPFSVVSRYLNKLCGMSLNYLAPVVKGKEYRIAFDSAASKNARAEQIKRTFESDEKRQQQKLQREKDKQEAARVENEKASQWNWLPEAERFKRNLELMEQLHNQGVQQAQICSWCHSPTANMQASICEECGVGGLSPIQLSRGYVASYPHRLLSMPSKRIKDTPDDEP